MTQPTGPFGFTGPRVAARRDAFLPDRCPVSPRRATGADQRDSLPSHGTPTSMTGPAVLPAARPAGRRAGGRWLAIVAASLLFHATLLDVLPHWSLAPTDEPPNDTPLHVTLAAPEAAVEPPRVVPVIPTPARPAPRPRPRLSPRPRPSQPITPEFVPESTEEVPQVALTAPGPSDRTGTAASAPVAVATTPQPAPDPPAEAPPQAAPPAVAATVPQSARLRYKVLYVDTKNFNTVHYYGVGSIDWSTGDGRYRSGLVAAVDFLLFKVNVLESTSEGSVGPSGLAPDRYTEKPQRRSAVATNFNRDARQSITFSASPATAPLVGGAQDRLSVLFQIGGLLLANPHQSSAGEHLAIPVAGVRGNVETWQFESLGVESIAAGGTTLETTHLRYLPRPDSNDRAIDIWIARNDGYPARVLYTEPNGNTTDLTLDEVTAR